MCLKKKVGRPLVKKKDKSKKDEKVIYFELKKNCDVINIAFKSPDFS
jgi:hypothetical protein